MTQTTVTYSLEEALKDFKSEVSKQFSELNQKIDKRFDNLETEFKEMRQDVTQLKVALATLTEKVDGMEKRLTRLEGTLTIQLWALILAVFGACSKYIFFPNFSNP